MDISKLQPLKELGNYISNNVSGGAAIVGTVKTGIQIVKESKLQLKDILKDSGEAAINAASARISNELNQSQNNVLGEKLKNAAIPIIIGVTVLILLMRKR